jgi:DNA-binding transcriptional regulator YhcF (GntR family)
MATAPTIPRTDLQRVLPTFRKAAALIDVHTSFISRAVRELRIAPVEWGRRER